MPSLLIADTTFENIVQDVPAGMGAMAREFGAFARSRSVRNPEELLRAVLLYCGLDYSLREVAANLTQAGRRLSDEAVRGRLSVCEAWLEAMVQQMLPKPDVEMGQKRLILVDGTCIQAPGSTTSDYRLHLAWDWMQQRVVFMKVTDNRTGESLRHYDWQPGDVALADSGYARSPQLLAVKEKGAEFIVRYALNHVRMLSESGDRLKIVDELKKHQAKSEVTIPVKIVAGTELLPAYLHAFRLSESAARKARRKIRRRASKDSRGTPSADTLYLADWMIILTSFTPEQVSAESICKLYRGRWQVELVIKRLKSVLNLGALRAKRGGRLAQVYLLGKSLYALIIEKRSLRLSRTREVEWRLWRIVADQIRNSITLSNILVPKMKYHVLKVLKERSRKRQRLRTQITKIVAATLCTTTT